MTDKLLCSRIDDMLHRAQRGEAVYSSFLNETQRAEVAAYIKGRTGDLCTAFFGGYDDAERTRLFVYPDYYDIEDIKDCIRAVEIRGSGYETLRHSSFLGALTSLGIDRAKMGDIVLKDSSAIRLLPVRGFRRHHPHLRQDRRRCGSIAGCVREVRPGEPLPVPR